MLERLTHFLKFRFSSETYMRIFSGSFSNFGTVSNQFALLQCIFRMLADYETDPKGIKTF